MRRLQAQFFTKRALRFERSGDLVDRFQAMIRGKPDADLDGWIAAARSGLLASFAAGITRDIAAVGAALC